MNKEQAINEMAQKLKEIRNIFDKNFPETERYLSLCILDNTLMINNCDKECDIHFFENKPEIEYSVEDEQINNQQQA